MDRKTHPRATTWALLAALLTLSLGLPGVVRHSCGADDTGSTGSTIRSLHVCVACQLSSVERTEPPAAPVYTTEASGPSQPLRAVFTLVRTPNFPVTLRAPPTLS